MSRLLKALASLILALPSLAWGAAALESGYPIKPAAAYNTSTTRTVSLTTTTNPSMIAIAITWDCGAAQSTDPTISGGSGLSWTPGTVQAITGTYANYSKTRWFYAWSTANQTGQTITLTRGTVTGSCATQLAAYSVTDVSQTIGSNAGKAGTCSVGQPGSTDDYTFTAAGAGSWVAIMVHDGSQQLNMTVNGSSTLDVASNNASQSSSYGAAHLTSLTSGAVSVTPGFTQSSTVGCYEASVLELKASGGGGSSYSDSISEAATAAESLANAQTMPNAPSEAVTAASSLTTAQTMPNAVTEAVTAGDTAATDLPGIRSGFPVLAGSTFSASAGDILVGIVNETANITPVMPPFPSTGLTWELQQVTRSAATPTNKIALFTAVVPGGGVSGLTVVAGGKVFAFDNVVGRGDVVGAGVVASGNPAVTLATLGTGSLILAAGTAWDNPSFGIEAGNTLVGSVSSGSFVARKTALTGGPGSVTIAIDEASSDWAIAGIELLAANAPTRKILALGDSLTEGYYSSNPYPHQLQAMMGSAFAVTNAGVTSQNSGDIKGRWDAGVNAAGWEAVIVLSGANDNSYTCVPADTTSIAGIWDDAVSRGIRVIAMVYPPIAGENCSALRTWVLANAAGHGVSAVVDLYPLSDVGGGVTNPAYLAPDGVHFNATGDAVMARAVRNALISGGFAEAVTAGSTLTNAMIWRNATTEMVTALDSLAHAATWTQAMTEAVTAAATYLDDLTPGGGPQTYSDAVSEALSALDALGHTQAMPNALGESVTAADSLAAAHLMVEVATVAVTAAESLANAAVWAPTVTEAVSAQDAAVAQMDMAATILEHVTLSTSMVVTESGASGALQDQIDALTARIAALETAMSHGGGTLQGAGGTLR